MRTAPTQAAAEVVSLFESSMQAIRVLSACGLRRMRDNAAALLEDVPDNWQPVAFTDAPEEET